ncbi:hypothetical protein UK23_39755, partial [Lentzea aerocolonigenes]
GDGMSNWSAWAGIGSGTITGTPAAVYKPLGNVTEVFTRNNAGAPVHAYIADNSGGWSDLLGMPAATFASDPVVVYKP